MKSVALVTYNKSPNLTEDDQLLIGPLQDVSIEPYVIPWDQEGVAWESFDAVILRSAWDYHARTDEFRAWLGDLKARKVNICNPLDTMSWNIDKVYLNELERKGIPIVPTFWIDQENQSDLDKYIYNSPWNNMVIKPTVGASSFEVHKFNSHDTKSIEKKVVQLLQKSGVMIQPFLKEIQETGELSLVFFDKKFSHAVLRKPKQGDFRNYGWGIKEIGVEVSEDIIQSAQSVVDIITGPLLYARVDGIVVEDRFLLLELELIEPVLFFAFDVDAPKRFVHALKTKI